MDIRAAAMPAGWALLSAWAEGAAVRSGLGGAMAGAADAQALAASAGASLPDAVGQTAASVAAMGAGHPALERATAAAQHFAPAAAPGEPAGAVADRLPESAASPWQASGPGRFGDTAAAPLTPLWVNSLLTPPVAHHPWPRTSEAPARRRRRALPRDADADEVTEDRTAGHSPQAPESGPESTGTAVSPLPDAFELLPAELRAELRQRRAVLVLAPAAREVQAWWLGIDRQGRILPRRLQAQGAPPAVGLSCWTWWRLRRDGDLGQAPLPHARPGVAGAPPLVLRITATRLPPPLRGPETAWLDLLEPQRLWRDLGSRWTWLTAWSPLALSWMD
jgi:hypothetical protein